MAISSEDQRVRACTWFDLDRHVRRFLAENRENGIEYDAVVGIARGGLIPAVVLSHELKIPLIVVNLSLRDKQCDEHAGLEQLSSLKNYLIVDDINDSGATFEEIDKWCSMFSIARNFWSLYTRKSSNFHAASSSYSTTLIDDEWIKFAWEA